MGVDAGPLVVYGAQRTLRSVRIGQIGTGPVRAAFLFLIGNSPKKLIYSQFTHFGYFQMFKIQHKVILKNVGKQ